MGWNVNSWKSDMQCVCFTFPDRKLWQGAGSTGSTMIGIWNLELCVCVCVYKGEDVLDTRASYEEEARIEHRRESVLLRKHHDHDARQSKTGKS